MRRTLLLAGLMAALATSAQAQFGTTAAPATTAGGGSASPFGNLAGQITGFGDASPAGNAASAVSSGPVTTLPATSSLLVGTSFRPGTVFLTPSTGSNAAGTQLVSTPATAPAGKARTVIAGGAGPRRFGLK